MILAILSCLIVRRARGAVALAFLLVMARVASGGPSFSSGPATMHPPHPAVARVIVAENGAQSLGSGTLIGVRDNCGLVITNWHVVRDAVGTILVAFPDGFTSPARVLKVDKDWDLAALVIWKPNAQPVSISTLPPQIGEPLMIAGYGSGNYRAAAGKCTQYVSPGKQFPFEMVELSAEARQGDSGGPIFNQRGELAGVLFGASRGTTSGSYGGRVRMFLGPLVPDSQTPPMNNSTMLAAQPGAAPATVGNVAMSQPQRPAISPTAPASDDNNGLIPIEKYRAQLASAARLTTGEPSLEERGTANDLLAPGLGGYGMSSLPDRAVVSGNLGSMIAEAANRKTPSSLLTAGGEINWRALVGESLYDQGKSMMALLGTLAMFFRFLQPSAKKQDG